MKETWRRLRATIGYTFKTPDFLSQALTHSSYGYETSGKVTGSNEVLEFLGDAVLNLAVAAYLVERFPERDEGALSRMRAELVNERVLARVAERIGLDGALKVGKSARAGGQGIPVSILADGVEALIGAVFRDGGYPAASTVAIRLLTPVLDTGTYEQGTDYKTQLQEYTQRVYKSLPVYRLEEVSGPDHLRIFKSSVWIDGEKRGTGQGRSIKASEQEAAKRALKALGVPFGGE